MLIDVADLAKRRKLVILRTEERILRWVADVVLILEILRCLCEIATSTERLLDIARQGRIAVVSPEVNARWGEKTLGHNLARYGWTCPWNAVWFSRDVYSSIFRPDPVIGKVGYLCWGFLMLKTAGAGVLINGHSEEITRLFERPVVPINPSNLNFTPQGDLHPERIHVATARRSHSIPGTKRVTARSGEHHLERSLRHFNTLIVAT
jgi:hypothetical protein